MSRTYRRRKYIERDCNCGAPVFVPWGSTEAEVIERSRRRGTIPWRECRCNTQYYDNRKRNFKRDRKEWYKPPKWYKQMKERQRRAKVKSAMERKDYDGVPFFHQLFGTT